jgi:hypothetical protein
MKKIPVGIAIVTLLAAPAAFAQDSGFSLKGFGTLGLVHSDTAEADYTSLNRTRVPDGAGLSRQTAFNVDSKLGAQVDWKATNELSATVQALSQYTYDKKYSPEITLALVKYAVSPSVDVRVGRLKPALYLLSDFIDVNYANPWVRPPVEFYAAAPIPYINGIDMLWRPAIGDVTFLVQPFIGTISGIKAPGDTTVDFKSNVGLNVTAQSGDFTYRFGYYQTKLTFAAPVVTSFFGANGVSGTFGTLCNTARDAVACTQAAELLPTDKKGSFVSLGVAYDNGEYFVNGEYGVRNTDSYLADATHGYVTGGMRFGKFTPYATYSVWKTDSPTKFSGSTNPTTNAVVTGLLLSNQMDQDTTNLGVRFDIAKNVALKAQWDQIQTHAKGGQAGTAAGLFRNQTTAFKNSDNTVKVISFSVDFVF